MRHFLRRPGAGWTPGPTKPDALPKEKALFAVNRAFLIFRLSVGWERGKGNRWGGGYGGNDRWRSTDLLDKVAKVKFKPIRLFN